MRKANLPVLLDEGAHDTGDDDVVGVLGTEHLDTVAPVGGGFLRDELDVEEGALAGTVEVTRGGTADDTGRDVGHEILVETKGLGDGKAPAGLEGAIDHVDGGAGRGTGKTKGVGETDAANFDADVNEVDGSVEAGDLGLSRDGDTVKTLEVVVNPPGGLLSVVDGLDGGSVSDEITSSKDPGDLGLTGDVVDLDVVLTISPSQGRKGVPHVVGNLRSKSRDDKVSLHLDRLLCLFVC